MTSLGQVAAIDPGTGASLWTFDPGSWKEGRPGNLGFVHRGMAYWTDGTRARLLVGTGDAYLIAVDAKTGALDAAFGEGGRVDLMAGVERAVRTTLYSNSSAPIVCRDVIVVGASVHDGPATKEYPRGDVTGYDARTGKRLWTFRSIPAKGAFGHDTWSGDAAEYTGSTNVWTLMSADEELGLVYLPFGTPTNDFYGGHRPGANLFAESIVAVDARTGERKWHFQAVHHGLWDYDLPAAPTLVDITVNGRAIKALAQVSKQGFTYVLDRRTGEPVWPIEERPVPQSTAPGERSSPTQPFPSRPPAFERQGLTDDNLIDFTPELRQRAIDALKDHDRGPLFTPPSERGTVQLPGWVGGANWGGAAFDPDTAAPVRAVDDQRHDGATGEARCREEQLPVASRWADGDAERRRPAAGEAALLARHGHRPAPGHHRLDVADGRRDRGVIRSSRISTCRRWAWRRAPTRC